MPQPHENILARAEAFFGQRLTPPPLEKGRRRHDQLGSAGQYGDLRTCYRALRDLGAFALQDQRNITRLEPIPVRLGAWEGQPGLLALVLGKEKNRWVSFYPKKDGGIGLSTVDWGLESEGWIGRFLFVDQPVPCLQVCTGDPAEVAVEAICSPSGNLDFVSPLGYFEQTRVAFSEAGDWAEVAFGKSNRAKTICWSDTSLHTFESGGTGTTTVEVGIVGLLTARFTVMVRDTSKNIRLAIEVLIGKRDFRPHLILNRVLFNPQKLGELVDIAGK